MKPTRLLVTFVSFLVLSSGNAGEAPTVKKWQRGKGWGWVWGKEDQVGALNEMSEASRAAALRLAKTGKVFDLGVTYNRTSYRWPGHNPGEIISFRTPEGVKRHGDFAPGTNPRQIGWHSCALFISDNVGTQIDGLGHITEGSDDHWYNGFRENDWGSNWGIKKCDTPNIPPIVARGVMIDVASYKGLEVLPAHYAIGVDDLKGALKKQGTELKPLDVVLIRTGTLRFWGEAGDDKDGLIKTHDTAGITYEAARWLVEENGAMLIGSDTSGLEQAPATADEAAFRKRYGTILPVHRYLLIEQGVHIGEFHNLEQLSKEKIYEFCYICCVNKIQGTVAGFGLRPIAMP